MLTPPGRAALATVVVRGASAVHYVSACFRAARQVDWGTLAIGRILFGRFVLATGEAACEEVVLCRQDDETMALHCHGGKAAVAGVVQALVDQGARQIGWEEYLHSRGDDPIETEARITLAHAKTQRAAGILLDQLHGALRRSIEQIDDLLAAQELVEAAQQIDQLMQWEPCGERLTSPWRVVLAGAPNVGKSSLLNALVGYSRAIVFAEPGTTRDVVTVTTAIDGWLVELADTAGIRATADALEATGIQSAERERAAADLVIWVCDATQPAETMELSATATHKMLVVMNKSDLLSDANEPFPDFIATSALTGQGIESLLAAIAESLVPHPPPPGSALPFTARQQALLRGTREALANQNLGAARDRLALL